MKGKRILYSTIAVAVLIILGITFSQLATNEKENDGSLPKKTLLLQKDYIKDHLKKYNFDYDVVVLVDENDYGILAVDMRKGDCKVVDDLILNSKDKIMEELANTQLEVCNMVKK